MLHYSVFRCTLCSPLSIEATTSRAFISTRPWVWPSQSIGPQGRKKCVTSFLWLPTSQRENDFHTALNSKAQHVICHITLSHDIWIYAGTPPLLQVRPLSFLLFAAEHLHMGRHEGGKEAPARSRAIPTPQFPASQQAFLSTWAQPWTPSPPFQESTCDPEGRKGLVHSKQAPSPTRFETVFKSGNWPFACEN